VKLYVGVASDAGVRRLAFVVGANEVLHDAPLEELLEVEREVRQSHPVRRVAGEEYRIRRAARAAAPLAIVQPESHGCDVVAGFFEKQGRDRRVDSPAHRGHNAPAAGSPSSVRAEHIARLAVPVVLEGLMQSVQNERERMLLAGGEGSAERALQIGLRNAGPVEEVFAFDQFRKGRAGGDARRTAVDLVSDMFHDVVRDTDRKAGDVAAGGVARLPPARRIG
jgi:hypothetical protein